MTGIFFRLVYIFGFAWACQAFIHYNYSKYDQGNYENALNANWKLKINLMHLENHNEVISSVIGTCTSCLENFS